LKRWTWWRLMLQWTNRIISQAFQDLSHSDFSGSIPAKFSSSSSLVLPNMSFNDISGSIPTNNVFRLMGSSAYEGNPKLCGAPMFCFVVIFGLVWKYSRYCDLKCFSRKKYIKIIFFYFLKIIFDIKTLKRSKNI